MIDRLTALHASDEVLELLRDVDSTRLAHDIGSTVDGTTMAAVARLRVAALVALAQLIGEDDIDSFLRQTAYSNDPTKPREDSTDVFWKWTGYIEALLNLEQIPAVDDLLLLAAAGFLARKPTEVRSLLRRVRVREALDSALMQVEHASWPERVRNNITSALLILVRQSNHEDVMRAGDLLRALAVDQQKIERTWLDEQDEPQRDAFTLLGLYHLAQAIIRISEFLIAGSVETDGRLVQDFAPELRRLLVRAEEYLTLSGDIDTQFWLNATAILLWYLRADSIWVAGLGVTERLDALLRELAKVGRENPIFSLMPSQQEALRQSLLDPVRLAVVLQMPTSAGKTLLAEFSIIQAFEAYRENARVVYITPTRALATQVRRTLAEDLSPLQIQVSGAGSAFEEDPYELHILEAADGVVVTTPEKLDLMLRAHPDWFQTLRLIVVDEAHLLKDSERGVRLELLLANIRREHPTARLLLLTPFVENAEQVASWLAAAKGLSISVHWRPSRILLGLASISGRGSNRALSVQWIDPYTNGQEPKPLQVPTRVPSTQVQTTTDKIVYLAEQFQRLGTVLAMCINSRTTAEVIADRVAQNATALPLDERTPSLRLAIALAYSDYGPNSKLAQCLERGVAFHHSALSPTLRYLIEDQVRSNRIRFIAATTTLAQGMNFPVATVLVHSVAKPRGRGDLSTAEFWNIAGRAGRVGLADKGLVIFADPNHEELWRSYADTISESLQSALLVIINRIDQSIPLKEQYRRYPELRPFIQYLAHAAASTSPARAIANVDELIQSSLANLQVTSSREAQTLRQVARRYLNNISSQNQGYLKVADTTGLGSFSFDELYGKIGGDRLLSEGPGEVLRRRQEGIYHLVDVLRWLPELSLAIGYGEGEMDVDAVARVVQGWIEGQSVYDLARNFPAETEVKRVRDAATYVYSNVSQTISWGAHAYIRGWTMRRQLSSDAISANDRMLPAYIEYGVNTPEAAVAALLNVPRQFAEPLAAEYRAQFGALNPESASLFKNFVETADRTVWSRAIARSTMANGVDPDDVRKVWRQMQGLE